MLVLLPLVPRHRPLMAWPTVAVPFLLSIAAAVKTRNLIVAPLACFLGMVAGSLMFALVRGWAGATADTVVPVAAILSVPSVFVALAVRRHHSFARNLNIPVAAELVS